MAPAGPTGPYPRRGPRLLSLYAARAASAIFARAAARGSSGDATLRNVSETRSARHGGTGVFVDVRGVAVEDER